MNEKKSRYRQRLTQEDATLRQLRKKESTLVRKIMRCFVIGLIAATLIGSMVTYYSIRQSLKAVDVTQSEMIEVEIPSGSSVKQIATILQKKHLIRDARMFNFYIKFKNIAGFKAGFYQLSPSMNLDQILARLVEGGDDRSKDAAKVVIREGEQLQDIAKEVEKTTQYTAEEFMSKVQDPTFIEQLMQKFPRLFKDAKKAKNVRYVLEGYLFPATYEMTDDQTLQMLIEKMVAKTDEVLSKYYAQIEESAYNVHQLLTMASLVEKEGVTFEDRQKIASVFSNRIAQQMMLQTDVSVEYALGEHKEMLTLADLDVQSAYNLYRNHGIGPGPFNSPSEEAIVATLEPADTDDLYFVADIQTKKVYFAKTYEEHLALKAKYVDKE